MYLPTIVISNGKQRQMMEQLQICSLKTGTKCVRSEAGSSFLSREPVLVLCMQYI